MIIEPLYSISILSSVSFCYLDIVFLYREKVILLRYLPLVILYYILAGHFKIPLLLSDFKKTLVSVILRLELVTYIKYFRSNITSTLLYISLLMLPYIMLLDSI